MQGMMTAIMIFLVDSQSSMQAFCSSSALEEHSSEQD